MIERNKIALWRWRSSCPAPRGRLAIPTVLSMLLPVSAATASGQEHVSVSDRSRFMLYNACRPMGVWRGEFGLSASDESTIELTPEHIQAVAESRLQEQYLYTALPSESNQAHLGFSVNIQEVCAGESYAYDISLKYNKLVTDAATGVEYTATTWRSGSSGSGATDSEFIVESFIELLDRFLEEYLRVNGEDCHWP